MTGTSDATVQERCRHRRTRYRWRHEKEGIEIAIDDSGGPGPAWLLLPALSTISTRREWEPFCAAVDERKDDASRCPRLIRLDWPGFGGSERLQLAYDADLLARFLVDIRRDICPDHCSLIAAGKAGPLGCCDHLWRRLWSAPCSTGSTPPRACSAG